MTEVAMRAAFLYSKGGIGKVDAIKKEQIEQEVKKLAPEGRLSCAQAFALADKLGVKPRAIGQAANDLKIKIMACQLGCF